MEIFQIIILPLLLGLLGFIEPCSIGINAIFLAHINKLDAFKRVGEAALFMLIRALVLSILGISIAFVGSTLFTFQTYFFIILGVFYIILGFGYIYTIRRGISFFKINLNRFGKNGNVIVMAIVFGLIIPACAIPLVLALLGRSLLLGDLIGGFLSMFIFGIGLSLPLFIISFSKKAGNILKWMSAKVEKVPYVAGIALIIIGIVTILSSYWWLGA